MPFLFTPTNSGIELGFGGNYNLKVVTTLTDDQVNKATYDHVDYDPGFLWGNADSPGIINPDYWSVTNGVNDIVIKKMGTDVFSFCKLTYCRSRRSEYRPRAH